MVFSLFEKYKPEQKVQLKNPNPVKPLRHVP